MKIKKTKFFSSSQIFASLPIIMMILIALIDGKYVYHSKVFKTQLLFLANFFLYGLFAISFYTHKIRTTLNKKSLIFYGVFSFFIVLPFIVSFSGKNPNYDQVYYFVSNISLLIFSLSYLFYLKKMENIYTILIFLNLFFMLIFSLVTVEYLGKIRYLGFNGSSLFEAIVRARPELSFGNPNYLACFLIGLIPLSFISVKFFKKSKYHKLSITAAFAGILSLFIIQSVGALIGLHIAVFAVFVPLIIYLNKKFSRKKKTILITSILILLLVLPIFITVYAPNVVKFINPRLSEKFTNYEYNLRNRTVGWESGLDLFRKNKILGAGSGSVYPNSFKSITKYYYNYVISNGFKHCHNEYIEILAETGIFGFLIYLSLIGFVLISLLKIIFNKDIKEEYRYLATALITGLVAILLHQSVTLATRVSTTMVSFYTVIGLSIFVIFTKDKKRVLVEGEKKNITLAIAILVILGISYYYFYPTYFIEKQLAKATPLEKQNKKVARYLVKTALAKNIDNSYLYETKYKLDFRHTLMPYLKKFDKNNPDKYFRNSEKLFKTVLQDIHKLDEIIPNFHNIDAKYGRFFLTYSDFLTQKYIVTKDKKILEQIEKSFEKSLSHFQKVLDSNFLGLEYHIYNIYLNIKLHKTDEEIFKTLKDYSRAKLLIKYGKEEKRIHENVKVNFHNEKTEISHDFEVISIKINEDKMKDKIQKLKKIKSISEIRKIIDPLLDGIE